MDSGQLSQYRTNLEDDGGAMRWENDDMEKSRREHGVLEETQSSSCTYSVSHVFSTSCEGRSKRKFSELRKDRLINDQFSHGGNNMALNKAKKLSTDLIMSRNPYIEGNTHVCSLLDGRGRC